MSKMGKHKEKSKKRKHEKKDKKKKHRGHKSGSSSSSEEWVEKSKHSSSDEDKTPQSESAQAQSSNAKNRDDWLSLPSSFLTESNIDRRKSREENKRLERERAKYNPREHTRELNPYWKDGGDGLPKFKKPADDYHGPATSKSVPRSNWKKHKPHIDTIKESTGDEQTGEILDDKELNVLASKMLKAEIMGNTKLATELKQKLETARKSRGTTSSAPEDVILTQTDSRGHSRPLKPESAGEFSGNQKKKRKVETHQDGQRVRYFADDDKHSLQQMFENEKYNSAFDEEREFVKLAGKIRKNDDLEEVFADNIRNKESDAKTDARKKDRAINEHHKVTESVDRCKFCLQSSTMFKHLMVTLQETIFISLPPHEPLTQGHCLIVPVRHVSCSTLLDENEWSEILDFRRALTNMFKQKDEDVLFFESAKNLDRYPHMYIECVPIDKEMGDMAPIYFKKAIDECEAEWAQNKKLVSLKGKDVRRAVPKGLSYFFVSFGMEEGYAHVIEDQKMFPNNFAQEIIGGMLDLHHSKWRKPKMENFNDQSARVLQFSQMWNTFQKT